MSNPHSYTSDTPRTDLEWSGLDVSDRARISLQRLRDHARQLERELAAARAAANSWKEELTRLKAQSHGPNGDQKDAERYRWLRDKGPFMSSGGGYCAFDGKLLTGDKLNKFVDKKLAQSPATTNGGKQL